MRTALLLLSSIALLATPVALGDEVLLEGGTRIDGVVLEHTDDHVDVLLPRGDRLRLAVDDVAEVVRAAEAPAGTRYLRYRAPSGDAAGALDVALVHLVDPEDGPRIDLVSAVHMGDRAYYREVQRLLEDADVVLYEAVQPEGATGADLDAVADAEPAHALHRIQERLGRWLDLTFQLDEIRYDRPHFVHADLTLEALLPGATPAAGDAREAVDPLDVVAPELSTIVKVMDALTGIFHDLPPALSRMLKRSVARQLGSMDTDEMLEALPAGARTRLLDERNRIVVDRLGEQIAEGGEDVRSIAVFFGAAHMPDIEARIVQTLGYRRAGARWLRAWRVP